MKESNHYLFGSVYIIERDYTDETIERDLRHMRECGFNLITLWPVGNAWLAPDSETYCFDTTKKVLRMCEQLKIQCILQLFGQNQAMEFMPDSLLTPDMEDHDESGGTARENNYWSNLNHPLVRKAFDNYFKMAITTLKDYPAVYGWDVFNEAHHRSDDPYTQDLYRQWLQEKYGTIQELNYHWYRRYASFNQIRPENRRASYSIWSSLLPSLDYERFRSKNLTDICKFLADLARKYDAIHPIIIDGSASSIVCDNILRRNCNEFELAYIPTIYGATYYPKSWGHDYCNTPWTLFMYFTISSSAAIKAQKPYAINELQTHTQSALTPGSETTSKELCNWILMCLTRGPKMMQLWRWRPFLHGYQVTGRGMTNFDGTINERGKAVARLVTILRKHENDVFANISPIKPSVALMTSYQGRLAIDALLKWNDSYYPKEVEGWYRSFYKLGINPDFIEADYFDEQDFTIPIIVLPSLLCVDKKLQDKLVDYVEKGGTLLADARLGTLDGHLTAPVEGIPGKTLSTLFGIKETDVNSNNSFSLREETIEAPFLYQILETNEKTTVYATMKDGGAAVTGTTFGKGRTYYFNSMIGIGMNRNTSEALEDFLRSKVLPKDMIQVQKEEKTHVSFAESDDFYSMLAINFDRKPVPLTLCHLPGEKDASLADLFDEKKTTMENGEVSIVLAGQSSHWYYWPKAHSGKEGKLQ
jgi:beta-galactosidase